MDDLGDFWYTNNFLIIFDYLVKSLKTKDWIAV